VTSLKCYFLLGIVRYELGIFFMKLFLGC